MATVTVRYIADALHLTGVETATVEAVGTVRDCVAAAFPDLRLVGLVYVVGTHEADPDTRVAPGDSILCAYRPEGIEITWAVVAKIVITALISAAVSYLVGYLMRPKQRNKSASPAYSVNIEQNAARLGGTIPVIYGRVNALPDLAAQAYSEFIAGNNERVSMLLCLGMGEFIVHDIFIGETRITDFPAGSIQAWIYPPLAHGQRLGLIEAETGIMEDCFTIPESTGIEFGAPNDPSELIVAGVASGGILKPNTSTSASLWLGLVAGNKYKVSNNNGESVVVAFVGVAADGSAQFDGPLPATRAPYTVNVTGRLIAAVDNKEGDVMKLDLNAPVPISISDGGQITVTAGGVTRGPYQPYRITGSSAAGTLAMPRLIDPGNEGTGGVIEQGPPVIWLRKVGPGFASTNDAPINPAAALSIRCQVATIYYIAPYYEGSTPPPTDPYRWRGWFALCRAGKQVDRLFVDIEMPGGIAWVTDSGNYNPIQITWRLEWQLIDDASAPVGPVVARHVQIYGATSNPQRRSFSIDLAPGRYRLRVARLDNRDQRASKEISGSRLAGIRARLYHAGLTPAYEACTILAMSFTATAGLSAAAGRRVRVDCTRKLKDVATGALLATTNPAEAFVDALEDQSYGAQRPRAELDVAQVLKLRPQWGTVNGFNGIFDQPITVVEALQAILGPVRAIPLPMGSFMSVAQDAPRSRDYVFSPETIVSGSLSIGYNFDGADEPDHLEIIFANPETMADERVYYPSKLTKPETAEIFGCTSAAHALAWGKLTWQERQANRKTVQLELEGEGYLIQPMTRFGVALPNIDKGSGGIVIHYDQAERIVSLDTPVPSTATALYFKDDETGKLLAPATITARFGDRKVRLAATAGVTDGDAIHPSDETGDATRWVAGDATGLFFEFGVTDLSSSGPMRIKVTGMQYTTAKYAGTFVENWVT